MPKRDNGMDHVRLAPTGTRSSEVATFAYDPDRDRSIQFIILGEPASKSNSRQFATNRRTGRRFSRKSDKGLSFVQSFMAQVPPEYKGLAWGSEKTPLRANVSVYYRSYRSDVDVELVWDCLQRAGVVSNDRWIREKHIYGHIDKDNARIEIRLEEI